MSLVNLKVCLLILNADKVLLIKEKSDKQGKYKWNVVKGTIENESIINGAIREAEEEINVRIALISSLGVHVKYYGNNKYTVYFMYTSKVVNGVPKLPDSARQASLSEDIIELKWFTREDVKKLRGSDFVSNVSFLLIRKFLKGNIYSLNTISSQDF